MHRAMQMPHWLYKRNYSLGRWNMQQLYNEDDLSDDHDDDEY